jgi:23S rRNA (uracil1939-C5)-methyltransferase
MEFSFSDNRWLPPDELKNPEIKKEGLAIGLHVPRYYDRIIDIEKCWLQDDPMNRILQFSREYFKDEKIPVYHNRKHEGILRFLVLRKSFAFNQIMVNVVTSKPIQDELIKYAEQLVKKVPEVASVINNVNSRIAQIAVGEEEFCVFGKSVIQEKIGEYVFEISANSFFQTNSLQAENLYRTVKDFADVNNKVVWDLYSGTGSIAIFLSDEAKKVVGFEILDDSVKDAQRNAEINQVSNCEFIPGDLRFSIENYSGELPDIIICDPPRSGMHPKVLELILKIAPQKIIYVSCNPTTLARDLIPLKEKYDLKEVQPLDMFPHTYHIENVCCLEKK